MSLFTNSVSVEDWRDVDFDVVYPVVTIEIAEQHGFHDVDDFIDSCAYYDWQDSMSPMMNFYWPVDVSDVEGAAMAIYNHAGNTSLIYLNDLDKYAIVLTGGGMDLSWDIAAAYVCCGDVPPAELLRNLSSYCTVSDDMRKKVIEAAHDAAERLDIISQRLKEMK